ncbi:hypothetical protein QMK33_09810 [Hymenobacter sp. H14-R3]|uniref:hypothetical protein n=1 Tax=Hymenobacter sp. H14-R3 TaxID=3046308 RepID=UPI0024B91462|nr:hypothetical protein [Hymenobacter sp. H14-R3]MDJ0365449.1 hypothetical protein [Hymenobacter sp. H14-R3]
MKKLFLMAALLGSTSLVSMAAGTPANRNAASSSTTVQLGRQNIKSITQLLYKRSGYGCVGVCLSCDIEMTCCGNSIQDILAIADGWDNLICIG